jgi:hypothetical protein
MSWQQDDIIYANLLFTRLPRQNRCTQPAWALAPSTITLINIFSTIILQLSPGLVMVAGVGFESINVHHHGDPQRGLVCAQLIKQIML